MSAAWPLPDEVDFIGYDNVDLCSIVSPKLEIVEQPMDEMGLRAAELLLARLTGDASPAKAAAPQGEAFQPVSPARKGV